MPGKILAFIFYLTVLASEGRDIVLIEKSNTAPLGEREAILILPGFGTLFHGPASQVNNFSDRGYDLFIPDYISRRSLAACVGNVSAFIEKHRLKEYRKVHVFSYIIGAWTINEWIRNNPVSNIATIVYDRSPLQERAPAILSEENPLLSRLLFGRLIGELARTPYAPLPAAGIKIGLVIECKATKIMWKKRRSLEKMPPVQWTPLSLGQEFHDHLYIFLNHDDIYTRLEQLAPAVLDFFRNARFPADVNRDSCLRDPFEPYRKKRR